MTRDEQVRMLEQWRAKTRKHMAYLAEVITSEQHQMARVNARLAELEGDDAHQPPDSG